MKIVIAPDSFKGSMTAQRVADAMEIGVKRVYKSAEVVKMPLADGGEGTVEVVHGILGGEMVSVEVIDPMGYVTEAHYCILDDGTAVMEAAEACGLSKVPEGERDVLHASSYGVGQMMKDALDRGCSKILIGLGGTATNDGGTGMAQALGVCFMDEKWRLLSGNGANLPLMKKIDASRLDSRIKDTEIIALTDVTNPLCGMLGATKIYGSQKGADDQQIELMEYGMTIYSELLKRDLGADVTFKQGAGAAGGLGAALMAFCGAQVRSGAEAVLELYSFEEAVKDADLVITGEGKTDDSSSYGKVVSAVTASTKKAGVKTALVSGSIECGVCLLQSMGLVGAVSLTNDDVTEEMAMQAPELYTANAVEMLLKAI